MSEENVDTFWCALDAFNRGDLDVGLELLHEDYELDASLYTMLRGKSAVFRGHDGYRDSVRDLNENFAEFHVEISEIKDLGERIVAIGELSGRGRESGAEFETPVGYLVEFKDGLVIRLDDYLDPNEALRAAGLSE